MILRIEVLSLAGQHEKSNTAQVTTKGERQLFPKASFTAVSCCLAALSLGQQTLKIYAHRRQQITHYIFAKTPEIARHERKLLVSRN